MFISSLRLAISNPGFTFGFEPKKKWACLPILKIIGLILLDLSFFLLHPIILKMRTSSLIQEQEAIKESRNLKLSKKFEKNLAKIAGLERDYYKYKRFELNMETISQITLSVLLYLYAQSNTTTFDSLKALFFGDEITAPQNNSNTSDGSTYSNAYTYLSEINMVLDGFDPIYAIVFNFTISILSFTRYLYRAIFVK